MKILVFIKLVPDLVEELSIDPSGNALDTAWLRMIINEFDDHALEQAILLKEKIDSEVIVIAPDFDGVDEVLYTAVAKGADQVIKLTGEFSNANNHALARGITPYISSIQPDLVLTGVQANNDIDGTFGPTLAACLNYPFIGYVSGVSLEDNTAKVRKEYPGGIIAEMSVSLPAVLGIQAAEQPPRYVAVSKVRQVMKTASISEHLLETFDNSGSPQINRMFQPETSSHAEMIEGNPDEIANKLVSILSEKGIL
ncbi:MAG: electron transfer flavoprotein subunit beta/FixA family protein [Chloroflexota bacterium]